MREILFRGKMIDTNEWIVGYFAIGQSDGLSYIIPINNSYESAKVVYDETVGEYTGLQDMNGNKIFEGDIVKFISPVYPEDTTTGKVEMYHGSWALLDGVGLISIGQCGPKKLKVIDNIHDNHELLEVK